MFTVGGYSWPPMANAFKSTGWRGWVLAGLIGLDALSVALALSAGSGNALDITRLPLGDGKVSTAPQRGYVYACPQPTGTLGAFRQGPWIRGDGTFDLTAKAIVNGSVSHASVFEQTLETSALRLTGNGLPSHPTGIYPIAASDDAYRYDRNPNRIRASSLEYRLPANPVMAAQPACLPGGAIGVMLSGAVLYHALDAGGRDALAHETQDACQGHPDPRGAYHYHSRSPCLNDRQPGQPTLLGYALDGFGIYSAYDVNGQPLTNADLDICHGRTSEVQWRGKLVTIYHYVVTLEYPYTLGCFTGTPVLTRR